MCEQRQRVGIPQRHVRVFGRASVAAGIVGLGLTLLWTAAAAAHERYTGCRECHGSFFDGTSPQGTIFPGNNKHVMHANIMSAHCDLCHLDGDGWNPFIGLSNGTVHNPGVGCVGCHGRDYGSLFGHSGVGLRAHHTINGVTECGTCHLTDLAPLPESVKPVYYGTPDTSVDDPCNAAPGHLENWSIGDTVGQDNGGDNLYDENDPDCGGVVGDVNCDGAVNALDIDPFILALTDPDGYAVTWPDCDILSADINGDGMANALDIDPFVALLAGG